MGEQLTKRQREILDFINEFKDDHGYAPSYREIGKNFNLSSTATIHSHVKALEEKGLLITTHNEARSIELVMTEKPAWSQAIDLCLAGLITAGEPIEAIEDSSETMAVPISMVNDSENTYVLKVKGESMIEDGIMDGDFVIIERNDSPSNGDMVVALIDGAYATLKRFYKELGRIRLQPANHTMQPIYATDVLVQGIVRGVIRKY